MAEKETKPKTAPKTSSAGKTEKKAKPAEEKKTTAPKSVKAASEKPAAKPKAAEKPAAKPKAAEKPAAKPKAAEKPAAKPKAAEKPAAKPKAVEKSAAKPKAAEKPEAKPKAEEKPAAKPKAVEKPKEKPQAAAPAETERANIAAATAVQPEKAKKQPKEKPAKQSGGAKGGVLAAISPKKLKIIIMSAVAFLLVLAILLGVIFGVKSCNRSSVPIFTEREPDKFSDKPVPKEVTLLSTVNPEDSEVQNAYKYEHAAASAVGFNAKTVNTVERKLSTAVDGRKNESEMFPLGIDTPAGQPRYPKYGSSLGYVLGADSDKRAARSALIRESSFLTATGTSNAGGGAYKWMDKDGYLYNGTVDEPQPVTYANGTRRKLYKHDAAVGLYLEGFGTTPMLSDEEPGIVKQVTIRPRGYSSYSVTGVYAPAGEIIKIEISEADMEATGGLTIHIGQALYNGQANNIWADKGQMQRIPHLLNTMVVNKSTATLENGVYTAYVGSFIGGPLYIRNTAKTFTATISGGVAYPHIILGYTSKEEYEASKKSTAPYFDLEVWNFGVLHSGPRYYSDGFSYEDLYKVGVLWEKVSSVTTTKSNQGIVFLYDPFVAAGAAVAFPGRRSVNCPMGWMTGSLNYNGIVTSGSWGNFHEYHHNFQGYGVGNGGEVTNNAMTLVSYALFTKISSKRGIGSYGGQGLGGWNNYTSATWALNDVLSLTRGGHPSNGDQGLALYATLLHNFGANNFIQAKARGGGQSYQAYANAWEAVTHNNMTYYFNDILKGGITSTAPEEYPMFVPVSCVYQTGRSFMFDGEKKYFKTMQPYLIKNAAFEVDLGKYTADGGQYKSGSIVIPDGFTYSVKSVTQPKNGSLEIIDNTHLKYTPAANAKTGSTSGQIVVTLEITKDDKKFKVDDVDLVLEFEISQELNRMTLERTTYTYSADGMYADAVTAYESGFAGYTGKKQYDHSNPTQNCNTDIWYYTDANADKFPNADPEIHKMKDNVVEVIDGKLYFEDEGKYRIYLRGRKNCAVYYSVDGGQTYKLGAKVTNGSGAEFYPNNAETYFDLTLDESSWVYIKEVLIVQSANASYIGLGYGKWTETMFTMEESYHMADGKTDAPATEEAPSEPITPQHALYAYTKTVYRDYQGKDIAYSLNNKNGTQEYFKKVNNKYVASTAEEVAAMTESKLIAPANGTYVNAYRSNYDFPDNKSFESDYFYTRSYNYNYEAKDVTYYSTWDEGVTIADATYVGDKGYPLSNILVEGTTSYCHNAPNTSVNKYITLDMGKTVSANDITFQGRTDRNTTYTQQGLPTKFKLEVSDDGETFVDAGTYTQSVGGVYEITVKLNGDYTFRYAKITILGTHSATGRLILSGIKFGYRFRLMGNGANLIAPTNENLVFSKNWKSEIAVSSFGRVYVGHKGDKVNFEFNGTRLAILTSDGFGKNFEVYIDGNKVNSIQVDEKSDVYGITYISEKFESGKHAVEIRCTGEANIDSFAIYNEA